MTLSTNIADGYQLRSVITVDGEPHRHAILVNVDTPPLIGTDFQFITLTARNDSNFSLQVFSDLYFGSIQPFYKAGDTIGAIELWFAPDNTQDFTFVSAYGTSFVGTSPSTTRLAGQLVFTSRSTNGGLQKSVFLETVDKNDNVVDYAGANADQKAYWDVVTGLNSPVLARDGGFVFSPLSLGRGQNERVYRTRYR